MCWLSGVTMETVIQWTTKNPSKPARQPAGYAFEHTSQGQVFASILACYYWPAATGNRTKTNPRYCAATFLNSCAFSFLSWQAELTGQPGSNSRIRSWRHLPQNP